MAGGDGCPSSGRRRTPSPPLPTDASSAATAAAAALACTPVKRSVMLDFTPFLVSARYSDLRLLARGSYGVVARATDGVTKQPVAIKKVHSAFDTTADARHLLREIRLLRHMRHPHVLPLLDLDAPIEYKNWADVYLVMPLLDTDLEVLLAGIAGGRRKDLSDHQKRAIFFQLLSAVAYLHAAGVAHRDIKPGNVLLSKSAHVMLGDLGLARYIAPGEDTGLTQAVVTKSYRAPELFLSGASEKYTSAIDLWSLGVLLFSLYSPNFPLFSHRKGEGVLSAVKLTTQLDAICRVVGTPPVAAREASALGRWYLRRAPAHAPLPIDRWFASPEAAAAVPADAKALMLALLRFDPAERLTAADALAHPYVAEFCDPAAAGRYDRPAGWADCLEPGCEAGGTAHGPGVKALSREEIKLKVLAEVASFHPDLALRADTPSAMEGAPDPDVSPRHRPAAVAGAAAAAAASPLADRASTPSPPPPLAGATGVGGAAAAAGTGRRRSHRRFGGFVGGTPAEMTPLSSCDRLDAAAADAAAEPLPAHEDADEAGGGGGGGGGGHHRGHHHGRRGRAAAHGLAAPVPRAPVCGQDKGDGKVHGSHGWRRPSERRLGGLFHHSSH